MIERVYLALYTLVAVPLLWLFYNVTVFILDVRRRGKAVDRFPGEPKHWFWGHLDRYRGFNEEGLATSREWTERHPRLMGTWIGCCFPVMNVQHYDTVKIVLHSTEPKPDIAGYRFMRDWLGDGLLLSHGKKWLRNRRLLTPAFHYDILRPYVTVNNDAVEILLDKISKFAENGKSFEVFGEVSLSTLDIILRCAMSYNSNCQTIGESHPYVEAVNNIGDLITERTLRPWLYTDFIYGLTKDGRNFKKYKNYLHEVSEDVINKRKQALEDTSNTTTKRYLDFLDILLNARDDDDKGLTFREIRDEVDTFLFEGHDTTSSSISWTLYSLAQHPEYQKQIREEVNSILAGRETDEILWDDLPKLTFLTQCIKEAMRLHTPVPFIERKLENDMEIDGLPVLKGTVITIQLYNLHHNPAIWDDPMEYKPERYLPENIAKRDPFASVPFSAGPRNCIGQNFAMHEQKVVLARLLHRYIFELDESKVKVEKKMSLVMRTQNGMFMKVTPA